MRNEQSIKDDLTKLYAELAELAESEDRNITFYDPAERGITYIPEGAYVNSWSEGRPGKWNSSSAFC